MSKNYSFTPKRNSLSVDPLSHLHHTDGAVVLSRLELALPSLDFQMILSSLPHKFL
jgi:hypothetical protein